LINKFDHILRNLDQVVFHDIPVKGFYVENDDKLLVRIDYFLYVESKKDYDEYSLVFSEIENMKFQEFSFTKENDLEIASFDYELEPEFIKCKILFLTGFAQASIDLEINCRNIEIIKNEHNTQ
jgi:hypothetical protein